MDALWDTLRRRSANGMNSRTFHACAALAEHLTGKSLAQLRQSEHGAALRDRIREYAQAIAEDSLTLSDHTTYRRSISYAAERARHG